MSILHGDLNDSIVGDPSTMVTISTPPLKFYEKHQIILSVLLTTLLLALHASLTRKKARSVEERKLREPLSAPFSLPILGHLLQIAWFKTHFISYVG
ncbi:hypothetical protein M501DRAFT_993920 [Patellaria atrata CBS 101060]|uniref:Uncharacterized protein n=1 Tax=Patellaria atrata CBS 101060 TaxID=1346257 RepID=A0A9P4SJR1_9PEZI|nr:hypothetical protein M501DRAFT_993920 [Patellaria atrata CBS 101060]